MSKLAAPSSSTLSVSTTVAPLRGASPSRAVLVLADEQAARRVRALVAPVVAWLAALVAHVRDRALAVAYGFVYDVLFESLPAYRGLRREIQQTLDGVLPSGDRRDLTILEVACGPGNVALALGESGYSVVGVESYRCLLDIAREKRRLGELPGVAFRQEDLRRPVGYPDATFDAVVNVHSLYTHPAPAALLADAFRVLKPGGHAVLVNRTRPLGLGDVARAYRERGLGAALRCLLWVAPNRVFEALRKPVGPHYWSEAEFAERLRGAGFTVRETRRTFVHGTSVLALARKGAGAATGAAE